MRGRRARSMLGLLAVPVLLGAGLQTALSAGAAVPGGGGGSTSFSFPGCDLASPQRPGLAHLGCPQPVGKNGLFELRGDQYVGHDEPEMRFISSSAGTGNRMTYRIVLPTESSTPGAVPSYQDMIAFWLGMPLCDPASYPQKPCTPDSDTNTGLGVLPSDAGSAFLELQFYPPGFPNFTNAVSCDATHWCAAQVDWSLECTFGFKFCNAHCTEVPNFGWLQKDGIPTGPPSPQLADTATFTPNKNTLMMNPGDTLTVAIHDTSSGLFTGVHDLTNGTSGFMVASVANGFMNTNVHSCKGTPFSFHPEYSSASPNNIVPWTALQSGPGLAVETGHFEFPDGDADDVGCLPSPTGQTACLGTDFDFDGVPYIPGNMPTALTPTSTAPSAISLLPLAKHTLGPVSNGKPYPKFELESIAGFTIAQVSSCNILQPNQCSVDAIGSLVPTYGGFYPFYSAVGCTGTFGDVTGPGVNDFGGVAGYGPSVPVFTGTTAFYGTNGAFYTNKC
jgi:hypothetical protein